MNRKRVPAALKPPPSSRMKPPPLGFVSKPPPRGKVPHPTRPHLVRDVHGNELGDLFLKFPDLPRLARPEGRQRPWSLRARFRRL